MSLESLLGVRRCLEAAGIWAWLWWLMRIAGGILGLEKSSMEWAASIAAMVMTPVFHHRLRLAIDRALDERAR